MKLAVALKLGRISNLPTVWSNVLVGALLAGARADDARLPLLMAAMSLSYVGGMFLNDAFDHRFDAQHRPERPIPAGEVSAAQVFGIGFGLLAAGFALVAAAAPNAGAVVAALGLAAAIVGYDAFHKGNPVAPLLMGLCRVLVVLTSALACADRVSAPVALAAAALLCHLIGLTYIASQEHLNRIGNLWPLGFLAGPLLYGLALAPAHPLALLPWMLYAGTLAFAGRRLRRRSPGDVPRAVVTLIAGMSLLDATLLAGAGHLVGALLAVAAFGLTLAFQRWVSGT